MATDLSKRSFLKELEHVIVDLLIHQPFFGLLLSKMVKVFDTRFHGISISSFHHNSFQLKINPEYWNTFLKAENAQQTTQLRKGALKKQVIHFIFNHDLKTHDFEQEVVFIFATELIARQYLEEQEAIDFGLDKFQRIKFDQPKTLSNYYQVLSESFDVDKLKDTFDLNSKIFEHLKNWKIGLTNSEKNLEINFRKQFILKSISFDQIQRNSNLPAQLIEYLNHLKKNAPKSINWKKILRQFCSSSNRTKLNHTIRRSSKRYGTFPGLQIKKQSKILVALDTSGSIKKEDLARFFTEINHLWKQNAAIRIVECDTHIRQEYNYKGKTPNEVKGRGNTDFNEPIFYANQKFNPDALVYFTDGFGPKPRIKPSKPILWMISTNGIKMNSKSWNNLPGRKVKMKTAP